MGSLSGRNALVAGAGGSIGRAMALALARAGATVVAAGRDRARLDDTCRDIKALDGRAISTQLDLSDPASAARAVDLTVRETGRLDVLVNAAGAQLRKPALEITPAEWDALMAVNLRGAFFLSQAAAHAMLPNGRGSIIHVTSLTEFIGLPRLAAYGASKGGLGQLTKALAVEWAPHGIRVNAIAPGRIRTPMTEAIFQDPTLREGFLRLIPQGRAGLPEDIGEPAVFLASDASGYMTGQTLVLDGGWLASGGNSPR